MQRCAFTPYEGKSPYIFVSYAHKDSDRVFPILEELDRRGYRIWYDDGIAPGSEWPENIAQHLDGCSLTLAFISPASIASPNCRREVTFALSKRKPFLGILLEPTEMSLGMEMQLSAQQCIMKYTYQSDHAFYAKICSCPDLRPCLGQPKQPESPVVTSPTPAPPTNVVVPVAPREKKPLNKKLIAIISGAAAAVAVLAIVLVIALSGGPDQPDNSLDHGQGSTGNSQNSTSTPAGSSTAPNGFTGETHLYYEDQVITAEDIAYISQQTTLSALEMRDCVIQAGAMDALQLANTVTEVVMTDCQGVTNLKHLASLENLESLTLKNCDVTDDTLAPFTATNLVYVDISGNAQFSDLSVFAGCSKINHLAFENTAVASVACLQDMADLQTVNGSGTQIKDVTPLASLSNLLELRLAGCGIETIDTTFYSLYLQTLDLSGNKLENLNAFENCTVLEFVDVSYNDLSFSYPLSKSAASLQVLNLSGNVLLTSNDVSFLKNSVNMKQLYLDGISLFNLDFLENMENLERLSAIGCSISSLTGLQNTVSKLSYLNLALNSISDIAVLNGLTSEGMKLDLSLNNNLTDVSQLPADLHYEVLNLATDYLDITTVPNVQGTFLLLAYQYGFTENQWLKADPFSNYAIVDCPTDQIVAMENMLGRNEVLIPSELTAYIDILTGMGIDCRYLAFILESQQS